MRPSEVTELMARCYSQRTPKLFLVGPPGCGKTSVVKQLPEVMSKEFPVYTFQATLYDPVELKGLPVMAEEKGKDGKIKQVAKFLSFEDMPTAEEGILLIDDLPHAPNSTQNAFMRVVLEGVAGSWNIGGLFPIATGNRSTDKAGAKDMQTAMANRFVRVEMEMMYEDWRPWAIGHDLAPEVIAYLGTPYGSEWIASDKFDPNRQVNPTPRSWEFASDLIKVLGPKSKSDYTTISKAEHKGLLREALNGTVGNEATSRFLGWLKVYSKLPDLQEIVAGKKIYPDDLDIFYATVSGLINVAKPFEKRAKVFQVLLDWAIGVPEKFTEMGVMISKDLYMLDKPTFQSLNLDKWQAKYEKVVL